jgi:uncharacterized membrane protein YbhN (UPF0104 family)
VGGLLGIVGWLSAVRLRVIAQATIGQELASQRRFYQLTMIARAWGVVLPRSVATIGGKAVGLRGIGLSLRRSLWVVLVDNLLDVLLLTAVTLPAIPFIQNLISLSTYFILYAICVGLLAIALWWGSQPGRLDFLWHWFSRIPWLAQRLKLDGETAVSLLPAPRATLYAYLLTILLNTTLAFATYATGRAIGTTAVWPFYLAIFPITQLSLIIAVAPGGLGIVDFTWAGLLLLIGVSNSEATIFAVAWRIYLSIFVLIWAGVSVLLNSTSKKQPVPPQ